MDDPIVGSISGVVLDQNGNGIGGVTLKLYLDVNQDGISDLANAIGTVITNVADGTYIFSGIEPSGYYVEQTQPFGYTSISDFDESTTAPDLDGDDQADGADENIPVIVMPGEDDADNNFRESQNGSISGNVSDDTGVPLSNIEITLYAADTLPSGEVVPIGDPIANTFTDGDTGDYEFNNIAPGNYVLVETQPANYDDEEDFDISPDPDGDDSAEGADNNIPVSLDPNESDDGNNFVDDPIPGSISGLVSLIPYSGIGNVRIELYEDNNGILGDLVAFKITGAAGFYNFSGVEPGAYTLVEIQPFGYTSVRDYDNSINANDMDGDDEILGPNDRIPVILFPGESDSDNNFIEAQNGSISGNVSDVNGIPLSNIEITLYAADTLPSGEVIPTGDAIAITFTDGDTGDYSFENIPPGTYVVVETQPMNYFDFSDFDISPDPDGDDSSEGADNNIPVNLAQGEEDEGNNFVDTPKNGNIYGQVTDELGNGLEGIMIELYNDPDMDGVPDGTKIMEIPTDILGNYSFTGIPVGNYLIIQNHPSQYTSISDFDASIDNVDLDGDDSNLNANEQIPVTISPNEDDQDNNFIEILCPLNPAFDGEAEQYICDGEMVTLQVVDQLIPNATYTWSFTDGASISSASGPGPHQVTYSVSNTNQVDGTPVFVTVSKPGCPEMEVQVTTVFVSPIPDAEISFANTFICATATQTFKPVADEIPGAIYTWEFGNGAVPSTANGYGPHLVSFNNAGSSFAKLKVDLNDPILKNCPDSSLVNLTVLTCGGNISGKVLKTNDSTGIQFVKVNLFEYNIDSMGNESVGDFVSQKVTNAEGFYLFVNITPGNYVLIEEQPMFYTSVMDIDTTEDFDIVPNTNMVDDTIPVTLLPSEIDGENIFWELEQLGAIDGSVFDDINTNEIPDIGEGIQDVLILLYVDSDLDGIPDNPDPYATTTTNENGYYLFNDVDLDNYLIVEEQPLGFLNVKDIDTSPDGDEFLNANKQNDTIPVILGLGKFDKDNHFIELFEDAEMYGIVYFDTNLDGTQDLLGADNIAGTADDEPFLPNIDVIITDTATLESITVVTNALGKWVFEGGPGDYEVEVDEGDPDFPLSVFQTEGVNPEIILLNAGDILDAGNDGYGRCVNIETFVFLEGAMINPSGGSDYNLQEMRTTLNDLRLLPGQSFFGAIQGLVYTPPGQPYNTDPWNYPGMEGDIYDSNGNPDMGSAGYPASVTDWVLVSIRSSINGDNVYQAAGLLHKDGSIIFVDEICVQLNPLLDYYISIQHRNHLLVMTDLAIPINSNGDLSYDFRHQNSWFSGLSSVGQKLLGINAQNEDVYAMYGGNGEQANSVQADTDINFDDLSFWSLSNNIISAYKIADYNMNGDVNLNDRIIFLQNNGKVSAVPND